jgi:putative restriction endonuclease
MYRIKIIEIMEKQYIKYIYENNRPGSNKANSYIKALEYLNEILKDVKYYHKYSNIYKINSVTAITELYKFIVDQQKLGNKGIFSDTFKKSYWNGGFYSAAVNSYKQFLIIYQYGLKLNKLIQNQPQKSPEDISKILLKQKLEYIEQLDIDNNNIISDYTGKERLQLIKTRVNQSYFRKMILENYGSKCCINGLNIPEVLRASHIIPWAENKSNRLNPTNGLCLSATYDAAFDRNLISFDKNYRLVLGQSLKKYMTNDAFQTYFKSFESKRIQLPNKFMPNKEFLSKHLSKLN